MEKERIHKPLEVVGNYKHYNGPFDQKKKQNCKKVIFMAQTLL